MLFSEHSNGIDLPRLRPLEVLRLVISSVGKHGASVFSCVKLSLRSCKRIWLATSASFLRFGSSFCSFEKIYTYIYMYINMRNYVHVFDCPQNVQPLSRLGFSGTSGWPFHRSIVPRSPGAEEPRSRKLAMQHAQEVVSRLDGSPTFSDLPWKLRLTDFSSANGKSPVQIRPFPSGWSRFRQHFIKVVPNQD